MRTIIFWLEFAGYILKTLLKGLVLFVGRKVSFYLERALYLSIELICWLVAKVLFRLQVVGRENIPEAGNFIIIARHRSVWDIPLMALSLGFRRQITFVARENLGWLKYAPFLTPYTLPVNRERITGEQIKAILRALRRGEIIGMFPEGTRDPKRKKPNQGAIFLAQRENIPISPLNIKPSGPFGAKRGDWLKYVLQRVKVELRIGEHFWIPKSVGKDDFESLTEDIIYDLDQI